ncbi:hypothetical protein ABPG75_008373 [Micractinium tetrahymenae]
MQHLDYIGHEAGHVQVTWTTGWRGNWPPVQLHCVWVSPTSFGVSGKLVDVRKQLNKDLGGKYNPVIELWVFPVARLAEVQRTILMVTPWAA